MTDREDCDHEKALVMDEDGKRVICPICDDVTVQTFDEVEDE
jgi:uncharacterized Zn finger protein (UPF0148 family)